MGKIPILLNIDLDRARGIAAERYHLSKDYLPSALLRALPMNLGSTYSCTFTLQTSKGTSTAEAFATVKIERIPGPGGLCVSYNPIITGIPEDKGYPSDFYASQVVEIAQRSIEFIDSILPYIRDPSTTMEAVARLATVYANEIREGKAVDYTGPCLEQALKANVRDTCLSYQYMRHGLVVGDIILDATVRSYIDQSDPTATLTTRLTLS